ncbi:MAG: hypothetical protein H0X29_02995 [Parachlamydiaceae bacterium]|nr:hypothetical protein [Parachlamydiaceae bacterium]
MLHYITSLAVFLDNESFYWFCALTGSGFFIIQFILTFIGLGDQEIDDGSADAGNIKWLSRQALTGFLMMFGWSALTCNKEFGLSTHPSLAISFAMGFSAILISGSIFRLAKKLQSPGSVFNINEIIGKEGLTYQRIPQDGVGKISISMNEMTQEIDAISLNNVEIASFTRIKVINVFDSNTVIIEKI